MSQNQFDAIDLSDNAIVRLEGFPRLPRLKALYLNNNRVAKVARNLHGARTRAARVLCGLRCCADRARPFWGVHRQQWRA